MNFHEDSENKMSIKFNIFCYGKTVSNYEKHTMRNRKIIILFSLLALLIVNFVSVISAQTKKPLKAKDRPLPDLILSTVTGQKWSLHERRGRVVLLNFWATWCAPCRTEVPYLVRLSDKYKANGLEVVGVTIDSEDTEQINNFIKEFKVNYPVLLTVPGSVLSRQKAVPMSLLIDEKGVLAKKYVGAIKENVFEKDIKVLLSKK